MKNESIDALIAFIEGMKVAIDSETQSEYSEGMETAIDAILRRIEQLKNRELQEV